MGAERNQSVVEVLRVESSHCSFRGLLLFWPAVHSPAEATTRLDLPVTIRSVHRPFEDRERQELGSPDDRLQDSSDPDTGSEEEGSSRLSPPHSPRGEILVETWNGNGM